MQIADAAAAAEKTRVKDEPDVVTAAAVPSSMPISEPSAREMAAGRRNLLATPQDSKTARRAEAEEDHRPALPGK